MSRKDKSDISLISEQLLQSLKHQGTQDALRSHSGQQGQAVDHEWVLNRCKVLYNYRWLILSIVVLIVGFAILKTSLNKNSYVATSSLNIGIYNPTFQSADRDNPITEETRDYNYINTQVKLLMSLPLADKALSDPRVAQMFEAKFDNNFDATDTNDFTVFANERYRHPVSELKSYLSMISISPVRKTSLLNVSVENGDPEIAALIANVHAESFIAHVREQRQQATIENLAMLQNQANELAEKVTAAELELTRYAEEHAFFATENDGSIVSKSVGELSHLLTSARAQRIQSEAAWTEAREGGLGIENIKQFGQRELVKELESAEVKYAELLHRYKPGYEKMLNLKARIDALKAEIESGKLEVIAALEAQYRADLATEEKLKQALNEQESLAHDVSKRQVQYNILKREYNSVKELHRAVMVQLKESQINLDLIATNIRIVEPAAIPSGPRGTQGRVILIISALFAPLLGAALAFALDFMDASIKQAEELRELTGLPLLGIVPDASKYMLDDVAQSEESRSIFIDNIDTVLFEEPALSPRLTQKIPKELQPSLFLENLIDSVTSGIEQVKASITGIAEIEEEVVEMPEKSSLSKINWPSGAPHKALVAAHSPLSTVSEAYRTIVTGIKMSRPDSHPRSLLISSSQQGDGKTFTALNLAVSLTGFDGDVAIIDCDIRKASVGEYFGISRNRPGLVEYITGQALLDQVLVHSPLDNLLVLPAGQLPPNPLALLQSEKMQSLIQTLSKDFKYVILDSAPVSEVSDPLLLSTIVDGVILVGRHGVTPKHLLKGAVSQFREANAPLIGCICNDLKMSQRLYSSYYYGLSYTSEKPGATRLNSSAIQRDNDLSVS